MFFISFYGSKGGIFRRSAGLTKSLAALVLLCLPVLLAVTSKAWAEDGKASMDYSVVASSISEFFSVSDMTVSRVEGGEVIIEGAGKPSPGMKFALYRGGEVFYHPVTGEPFGTGEKEV